MEAASAHSSRELGGLLKSPFRRLARVRKVRSGDPGWPQPASASVTSLQRSAVLNPAGEAPPVGVASAEEPAPRGLRGDGGAGQGEGRGEGTGKKGQGGCARALARRLRGGAPVRAQEGRQPERPLSGWPGGAAKSPASGCARRVQIAPASRGPTHPARLGSGSRRSPRPESATRRSRALGAAARAGPGY